MKKLILILSVFVFAVNLYGQDPTINKGSGWFYFSDKPSYVVPNPARQAELAVDTLNWYPWRYNSTTLNWKHLIPITWGSGVPSGDPGGDPNTKIDTVSGVIYYWDGAAWQSSGRNGLFDVANDQGTIAVDTVILNQNFRFLDASAGSEMYWDLSDGSTTNVTRISPLFFDAIITSPTGTVNTFRMSGLNPFWRTLTSGGLQTDITLQSGAQDIAMTADEILFNGPSTTQAAEIGFWEASANGTSKVRYTVPDDFNTTEIFELWTTDGNPGDVIQTDGAGTLTIGPISSSAVFFVNNGLSTISGSPDTLQWGGALVQNTTVTGSGFNVTYDFGLGGSFFTDLSATGNFDITGTGAGNILNALYDVNAIDLSLSNTGAASVGGVFIDNNSVQIGANNAASSTQTDWQIDDIIWNTDGTEKMRLTSAGNLGIGINTPTATTEIKSNADTTILKLRRHTTQTTPLFTIVDNSGTEWMRIDQDNFDNTFIGRSAGSNNAYVATANGSHNTFVGSNSGAANTSGYANTALGFASLGGNGSRNVAIGYQTLFNTTTGSDNVAIGVDAGYDITSGSRSFFMGYHSGVTGTAITGDANIGIGYQTFQGLSSGFSNIAIGNNALIDLTTGYNNTVIGKDAGFELADGNLSTFIGTESGRDNISGVQNTAVGYRSLWDNLSSYNTAIGTYAMQNNLGNSNVALGYEALKSGSGNTTTAIGYRAGFQSTGGGVFLGYRAGDLETGANKLYIDNSNTTTPLIGGDFSTNALTVNGTIDVTNTVTFSSYGSGNKEAVDLSKTIGNYTAIASDGTLLDISAADLATNLGLGVGSFTAGSVLFADTDGSITEDNAGLFYNNTSNRLLVNPLATGQKINIYENVNTKYGFGIESGAMRLYSALGGNMVFGHMDITDGVTFTERMRLNNNGNVGVGVTSPVFSVDVNGVINTRNLDGFRMDPQTGQGYARFRLTGGSLELFQIGSDTGGGLHKIQIGPRIMSEVTYIGVDTLGALLTTAYGSLNMEAVDLSKTIGNYTAVATDGTLLDISAADLAANLGTSGGGLWSTDGTHIWNTASPGTQRVGINVTSPQDRLHISGNALFENENKLRFYNNDATITDVLRYSAGNDAIWDAKNDVLFRSGGITRIFIDNGTGRVGINTSSVAHQLDVNGNISGDAYYINNSLIADIGASYTRLKDPSSVNRIQMGDSGDPTTYYDNGSHTFRSAAAANYGAWNATGLGIGTTSPSNKLTINQPTANVAGGMALAWGSAELRSYWTTLTQVSIDAETATGTDGSIKFGASAVNFGSAISGSTYLVNIPTTFGATKNMLNFGDSARGVTFTAFADGGNNADLHVNYRTTHGTEVKFASFLGKTGVLRLDQYGALNKEAVDLSKTINNYLAVATDGTILDISTADLASNLGVGAGSYTAGSVLFADTDGSITESNAKFFWDNTNKYLGVGTALPLGTLHVEQSTLATILFEDPSGAADEKIWAFQHGTATGGAWRLRAVNDAYASGNNAIVINRTGTVIDDVQFPGGNVGIGTTSPNKTTAGKAVTLESSTFGAFEFSSTQADADNVTIGELVGWFDANSASHDEVAQIQFNTDGTTANQRGGEILFKTKPNGSTALTTVMGIGEQGQVYVGEENTFSFEEVSFVVDKDYTGETNTVFGADFRVSNTSTGNITGIRVYPATASGADPTSVTGIDINTGPNQGTISTNTGILIRTPVSAAATSITTARGIYILDQKTTEITTAYGVYQQGASTQNFFEGDTEIAGIFTMSNSHAETAVSTPAQLTASVNNYALAVNTNKIFRISSNAGGYNITGINAPTKAGTIIYLINTNTTNSISLSHDSASSTAANRILTAGGASRSIAANGSVTLWYDGTSSRWRVVR